MDFCYLYKIFLTETNRNSRNVNTILYTLYKNVFYKIKKNIKVLKTSRIIYQNHLNFIIDLYQEDYLIIA